MDITFKNNKLEKKLTDPKNMAKAFGVMAKKINQRMKDLTSAENLELMKLIPAARCHELSGDKKGALAVDVSGNYRLVFVPDHNPKPLKTDGGLNWNQVKKIKIIAIEDYH